MQSPAVREMEQELWNEAYRFERKGLEDPAARQRLRAVLLKLSGVDLCSTAELVRGAAKAVSGVTQKHPQVQELLKVLSTALIIYSNDEHLIELKYTGGGLRAADGRR